MFGTVQHAYIFARVSLLYLTMRICAMVHLRKEAAKAMRQSHLEPIDEPWEREGVLTKKLYVDTSVNGRQRFHKFDLWHAFHLGAGKHWCGCSLLLLSQAVPGSNADLRFAYISSPYMAFFKSNRLTSIINKIDQHSCSAVGGEGTWNKAAITSNIAMFLEDFLSKNAELIHGNDRLKWVETVFEQGLFFLGASGCLYGLYFVFDIFRVVRSNILHGY